MISEVVLTGSQASVTFDVSTLAAQGYRHLQLRTNLRDDRSGFGGSNNYLRFNGDTASNYAHHQLYGTGSGVGAGANAAATSIYLGDIPALGGTASTYGPGIIDILDFASSTKRKTITSFSGMAQAYSWISYSSGSWRSTAPITSITIVDVLGNFVAGSRFSLYATKDN